MLIGYRCTVKDEIKNLSVNGNSASGRFIALEAHAGVKSEQTYGFTYLVAGGVIKNGNVYLLAGHPPPGCT
jgi:hypothetical protein